MAQLNILIADDSKIIRTKLARMIVELGHNVVGEAGTGMEAIDLFAKTRPDLITMDITMPDMDGIMATSVIIDADPNARIIVLTSHAQEEIVKKAIEAGAKGFIVKPVSAEKLEERIRQVMEI